MASEGIERMVDRH